MPMRFGGEFLFSLEKICILLSKMGDFAYVTNLEQQGGVPMNTQTMDGRCYARMLLGGAEMLAAHAEELNALNVFPVADGDTGTNMLRTLEGGLSGVASDTEDIGRLSERFARGVLLSADSLLSMNTLRDQQVAESPAAVTVQGGVIKITVKRLSFGEYVVPIRQE